MPRTSIPLGDPFKFDPATSGKIDQQPSEMVPRVAPEDGVVPQHNRWLDMAVLWTDSKVKNIKLPPGKKSDRPCVGGGLYLRLEQNQSELKKSWQVRIQVNLERKWLTIGEYPAMCLADARTAASNMAKARGAAKRGETEHPIIEVQRARESANAAPTVADAFEAFLADKKLGSPRKGGKPVRDRTIFLLRQPFDADIGPIIGDRKIGKITKADLERCIDAPRRRESPGAARNVYRTLKGLVSFCLTKDLITGVDPMRGVANPAPYRVRPPNAALDHEMADLLRAIDASQCDLSTKFLIEFNLMTGCRPSESRLATWSEINLSNREWSYSSDRTKQNRDAVVFLSQAAVKLLERAKSIKHPLGDYVFPSASGGPLDIGTVGQALERIHQKNPNVKLLRAYDLRKTMRTALIRVGVSVQVAELCIAHQDADMLKRIYDGNDYAAERKDAWERIGTHIESLRKISLPRDAAAFPLSEQNS